MKSFFAEFRDFIKRGSFIELAAAVVIAGAVTAVINSIVEGLINPLIAAVFGEPSLADVGTFTINDAQFSVGIILDALIYFVAVAFILFLLIKAYNRFMRTEEAEAGPTELELLAEIRDELRSRNR